MGGCCEMLSYRLDKAAARKNSQQLCLPAQDPCMIKPVKTSSVKQGGTPRAPALAEHLLAANGPLQTCGSHNSYWARWPCCIHLNVLRVIFLECRDLVFIFSRIFWGSVQKWEGHEMNEQKIYTVVTSQLLPGNVLPDTSQACRCVSFTVGADLG